MLHLLESYVHCEVSTASLAVPDLDVSILVVAQAPLDEFLRLAEDAGIKNDRFNDSWLDYSSEV